MSILETDRRTDKRIKIKVRNLTTERFIHLNLDKNNRPVSYVASIYHGRLKTMNIF